MTPDVDAVTALIGEVARSTVLPRHRALRAGEVEEKSPGELVTIADREAEALLTAGLAELLPGVPVIGEEAATADPNLLELLTDAPAVWLVDPVDGTANFVAGSEDFAVMVALVVDQRTVAAWIHRPTENLTYVAELGSGAFRNGRRLVRRPASEDEALLRGAVLTTFLTPAQKLLALEGSRRLGPVGHGRMCAGVDYPLIAEGGQDFVMFWRTLPWDHAPGALILEEAGGAVRHLDGSRYTPARARTGLLAAADPGTYGRVLTALALR